MAFPSEHYGKTNTRKWYKIRWKSDNKLDLLIDEDYEKSKNNVIVLQEIRTDKCAVGLQKINSEKDIDEWIKVNAVKWWIDGSFLTVSKRVRTMPLTNDTLRGMGRTYEDIGKLRSSRERGFREEAKSLSTGYLETYIAGAEQNMGLGKVLYYMGRFLYRRGLIPPNSRLHIYREELDRRPTFVPLPW